jgi:hypothetical protein
MAETKYTGLGQSEAQQANGAITGKNHHRQ